MIRSIWKPFLCEKNTLYRIFLNSTNKKRLVVFVYKNSVIFPSFVGNTLCAYVL